MKSILIAGASGFIGRNIIEQLSRKYRFTAPSHQKLDLTKASRIESFFKKNKSFDTVIHCANFGGNRKIPNTTDIAINDLKMFFNLANMQRYFKKMIHIGTGAEFGKDRPIVNVREVDFGKRVPNDPFGLYKYLCAKYIEQSDKIINLRLFGIYGKYEDYEIRFISNAICKSILKIPITINQNVFFDYLYIGDFIKILDHFIINKSEYKTYNVGTGRRIDLLTIAKKINTIAPQKSAIIIRHKNLNNEYTCNNHRLLEKLGNFKFTNLDLTLKDLYNWYSHIKPKLKSETFLNNYF